MKSSLSHWPSIFSGQKLFVKTSMCNTSCQSNVIKRWFYISIVINWVFHCRAYFAYDYSQLENLTKLQINYVTEFYFRHNNYSSELVVSSEYGFLTVSTAFFAWLKILPRRIKSIKLKIQMIAVPEMTQRKLGPIWMNGKSVGCVFSSSALKW